MATTTNNISLADILGPWIDPDWDSGLIDRCRKAWNKPLIELSRGELATLLRQKIAIQHILPIAKQKLQDDVDDDTEMFEGELQEAADYASKAK
jgi:hypothetical protein